MKWEDLLGDSCGLSECVPEVWSGVSVVSDVLDLPFFVGSDGRSFAVGRLWNRCLLFSPENVKPFCVESQEDMTYDGTPVKAPPASRRKIMPPTPQQSLQPSIEAV